MSVSFFYGTTLRRLFRFPWKFRRHFSLIGGVKLFSLIPLGLFNSILAIPDFFFRGKNPKEIVIIVGHYRSGTTHLYNLMEATGDMFAPSTYECAMPYHFLFTNIWLKPIIAFFTPKKRLFDSMKMDVNTPQEDEIAMATCCAASPYLVTSFPFDPDYFKSCISISEMEKHDVDDWKNQHRRFIRKLGAKSKGKKGLILKSPAHASRISLLLEMYPNAKFIHIHRNPISVVRSSLNLYRVWYEMQTFGDISSLKENTHNTLLETYSKIESDWDIDHKKIDSSNRIDIAYSELKDDPKKIIKNIFSHLGLEGFSENKITSYLNSVKDHQKGKYPPLEDSMMAKMRTILCDYCKKYQYEL